jgi:hypothetical protein
MDLIQEQGGFRVGEEVICILNNRSSLTVGKAYKIIEFSGNITGAHPDSYDWWISVKNDIGYQEDYHHTRFINKNEFRNYSIEQITEL